MVVMPNEFDPVNASPPVRLISVASPELAAHETRRYYKDLTRISAAFALIADARPEAAAFLAHLKSPAAAAVFRRQGFVLLSPQ